MKSLNETTKKMWESDEQSAFLSVGRMRLKFPELSDTTDYKRTQDMDKATSEVAFKKDGVGYQCETFISNPDNVMVTPKGLVFRGRRNLTCFSPISI